MAGFDKELLFKQALPEADVELPGKGSVRVRGLTRTEALGIKSAVKSEADAIKRTAELERKMLALAMIDPEMTETEVGRWQQASAAGEMDLVVDQVQVLSGMARGEAKAAYKEFEADPESEFRLPPG